MKVFFDMEFTGLHKNTTLQSIGLISENKDIFYGELTDYDVDQVDEWNQKNVVDHFTNDPETQYSCIDYLKNDLENWFKGIIQHTREEKLEMWGDCLAYDWVLFCDIFGHAFNIPDQIYYIPFDICTLFKIKGIDPDINRIEFIEGEKEELTQHNSFNDAVVIKECYEKLMEM